MIFFNNKVDAYRYMEILLFHLAITLTFLTGPLLWGARFGWVLISMICVKNKKWIFYAIFFYAAFFISSGFAKDLFFTLKHFHISMFILILIQLLTSDLKEFVHVFLKASTLFLSLAGILMVVI